jgi:hypothetical protein
MKKIINFVLLLTVLAGMFAACDDQKTMQEYLREENKAIERYIASQGIKVLKSFPADTVFNENEYYETTDGLYLHIVDKGNNERWKVAKTALVRCENFFYIKSYVSGDTTAISFPSAFPIKLIYGFSASYTSDYYGLACAGWAIPLQYVGEDAIVDLIIPSKLGNSSANTSFQPMFFKNLKYTKTVTDD